MLKTLLLVMHFLKLNENIIFMFYTKKYVDFCLKLKVKD